MKLPSRLLGSRRGEGIIALRLQPNLPILPVLLILLIVRPQYICTTFLQYGPGNFSRIHPIHSVFNLFSDRSHGLGALRLQTLSDSFGVLAPSS